MADSFAFKSKSKNPYIVSTHLFTTQALPSIHQNMFVKTPYIFLANYKDYGHYMKNLNSMDDPWVYGRIVKHTAETCKINFVGIPLSDKTYLQLPNQVAKENLFPSSREEYKAALKNLLSRPGKHNYEDGNI